MPGRQAVFIYPWTGRPGLNNPPGWDEIPGAHGSTPELEAIRNLHSAFLSIGVSVFAVSTQDSAYQRELAARLRLEFEILSDAAGAFSQVLRLPRFETDGVAYLKRLTFVMRGGRIERTFYPVHPPDTHPREVLAWATASATYEDEARLMTSPKR